MADTDLDRSPEGRFVRVSDKRMAKALAAIASVAKLSDGKNYRYSDEQVQYLLDSLRDAVQDVEDKFELNKRLSRKDAEKREFKMKEFR